VWYNLSAVETAAAIAAIAAPIGGAVAYLLRAYGRQMDRLVASIVDCNRTNTQSLSTIAAAMLSMPCTRARAPADPNPKCPGEGSEEAAPTGAR